MYSSETNAVCRGCGLVLRGKPFYLGGHAYHPRTNEQAKVNYFGGYVCSRECDYRASLEQESSMPGHGGQQRLSPEVSRMIERRWGKIHD